MIKTFVVVASVIALLSGTDTLQFVGLLLTVGGTIFVAVYSQNSSRRTQKDLAKQAEEAQNRDARTAVDAEAYERARESYEATVANYKRDLAASRSREEDLELRLNRAFRRISNLEGVLRQMGVEIPPDLD